MSVKEVTYYVAVCDCCGAEADYGDYSAWAHKESALDQAESFESIDDRDLCDSCWRWPSDEEAEAAGSDDPIPAHATHPKSGGSGS